MSDNRDDFIIAIRYALLKKGAKQKFSLFFLIILSISIITVDRFSPPFIKSVRSILNDLVYHVSVASMQPVVFKKYIFNKVTTHYKVVDQNNFLKKEIEFLRKEKFNNAYLKTENQLLKKTLELTNIKNFDQNFSILAKVILDQKSPFLKSILINRGTKNGIEKGMTVFHNDYLMGTIIEVNYLTSRVLLLTDLNSKIPVIIEDSNTNAILEGRGNKKNFRLSYLPIDYKIKPNKIIFTSGKGGYLVSGIPLAITRLDKNKSIVIKLLGDPDQALIVNVTNGQIDR